MNDPIRYRAFLLDLPLRAPIPVAATVWRSRSVVLLRAEDDKGRVAWGEAAPLDGYGKDTLKDVFAAIAHPDPVALPPSLACALGTIRLGLSAAHAGSSFAEEIGPIKENELCPARLATQEAPFDPGDIVKLKVRSIRDVEEIKHVLAMNDEVRVRLDGNRQLSREETKHILDELGVLTQRVEFLEEPFPGCFEEDHRADFSVPLAIDESLDGDNWRFANVVVIKPSLMGDPAETANFAKAVQGAGRRVVVSSAFESAVGMTMLTWLAARLGDAAPGLGTYSFMAEDVGGRSSLWDFSRISMDAMPAIPCIEPGDLEDALAGAARSIEHALSVTELTIPGNSWLSA